MYADLRDRSFEIIAAAQDTGGEAVAGEFYDAAHATFTTLIDTTHAVSSAFHFTNVPMGVWIDEQGRSVRPAEPAWTASRTNTFGGKPLEIEGEAYVAALRDWVINGEASAFVLSDEEFARRVTSRSPAEREADASFKLAVWCHQTGNTDLADKHFARAQALNPADWNYHRQQWSFAPDANRKWLAKFHALDQPYYPTLQLRR